MAKKSKEQVAPKWLDTVGRQTIGKPMEPGRGAEILDSTPMAIPAGFKKPESLADTIRRLKRLGDLDNDTEVDTYEDSLDFAVDDDFDPTSPWETVYDSELGREVTHAEYAAAMPRLKVELGKRVRNHLRYVEEQQALDDLEAKKRGAGVSPAPSSDPSPAEPLAPRRGVDSRPS